MASSPRIRATLDRPTYEAFIAIAEREGKSVSGMAGKLTKLYVEGKLVPEEYAERYAAKRVDDASSSQAECPVDGVHTMLLRELTSGLPPITKGRRLRFYHVTRLMYLMAYAFIKVSDDLADNPKLDSRVKECMTDFMKAMTNNPPKFLQTIDNENR